MGGSITLLLLGSSWGHGLPLAGALGGLLRGRVGLLGGPARKGKVSKVRPTSISEGCAAGRASRSLTATASTRYSDKTKGR